MDKAILKDKFGLSQLVRCPKCHYMVYITDVIWKRQPNDVNDDGEIERCRFDSTQDKATSLWPGTYSVRLPIINFQQNLAYVIEDLIRLKASKLGLQVAHDLHEQAVKLAMYFDQEVSWKPKRVWKR